MRLHNRQVKAAFWTDPELLQLTRDKRMFYQGLWQLADDSGCLEDSPFAFKIQIYPSPVDNDITSEVLAGWRDEFIDMKKVIPYEAEGKKCLFLVNFHKHQALRSPAPPDVPLPPWVEWKPGEKPKAPGKFVVYEPDINRTETVRTPYDMQPEPEVEPEPFIDPPTAPTMPPADENLFQRFEQEFNRPLSPIEAEKIMAMEKEHPPELVTESLKRAVTMGKVNMRYIESILADWKKNNIRTLLEVQRQDKEFEQRKVKGSKPKPRARPPDDEKKKLVQSLYRS